MSGHRHGKDSLLAAQEGFLEQVDPGDGNYINVLSSPCIVGLITAGAETRKVYDPVGAGQILCLTFITDGGDCVVTFDSEINVADNTIATFEDVSDTLTLISVPKPGSAGSYVWSVLGNDGAVALS